MFHAPLNFLDLGNFCNQYSVTVIHLKDLPFNTCLDGLIGKALDFKAVMVAVERSNPTGGNFG